MSILSQLQSLYFCYFSKPQFNRPIYRAIRRHRLRRIVELGIGDGRRALRMIRVAKLASPAEEISYVGLDLFEARTETHGRALTLKAAHQLLRAAEARVQLVPGNPPDALMRVANSLGKIDLLVLPAEMESPACGRVWYFVPRLLHERSLVFVERILAADTGSDSEDGRRALCLKPRREIDELARLGVLRRAA